MSPGRSPWLRQAASTTRGRVFGAADRLVRALGGRRKGRAPILRVYLGADFDFWLLGLYTPPDYCSDHVREYLPRGWDRIELWVFPTAPGGRRKARAPISHAYLGADFDFWLLGLDTPPDYRSDHVRDCLPHGGDRIELWFVPNGPRGAQEGPGAYFARVLGRR